MTASILILGASYGSLLATRLLMAGHRVSLVCTRPTADLINREGTVVRFPVKGQPEPVSVASGDLPGALYAVTPEEVVPQAFDLVVLGMQESQYAAPEVRELLACIAQARKPCLAIMNMPPLPYLARIPGLDINALADAYTDASVWAGFDPDLVTLASPDPQAFRPADEGKNVLQVGLATNFKVASFGAEAPNRLLRQLEADIEAARYLVHGQPVELPVKLKVHDSVFVPLAKWPMLLTGNYRCILDDHMIPIREAVHADPAHSWKTYEWVANLCRLLGAESGDLVPFEKYAQAASSLGKPSSAARALAGGARHIERVDRLVGGIARQLGLVSDDVNSIVARVEGWLARNRAATSRALA